MGETSDRTTFADRYQSVLVPVIFEPWARELIRRAVPRAGEDVLDLGCGTGVVTRAVAGLGIPFGSLTGADHSAGMLAVARRRAETQGLVAEWVEADAAALPFADESFDLAFCQQALQFFPDKPAAASELYRVFRPGGRAVLCVQRELEANPMLKAQAEALEVHVGPEAGAAVRAICGFPDGAALKDLFAAAGFRDVAVESVTLELTHPDARVFAAGAMGGMHTGDKLSGLGDAKIAAAIDAFVAGLEPWLEGPAMRFPHVSNVVTARR